MTTQTQLINGVDFIAFPTKDWEAARKFYGETLGLPFGKQWGEMPAGEFETGTVTIALMQVDAFLAELGRRRHHGDPSAVENHDVVGDIEHQLGVLLDQDDR